MDEGIPSNSQGLRVEETLDSQEEYPQEEVEEEEVVVVVVEVVEVEVAEEVVEAIQECRSYLNKEQTLQETN